jgi:ATP-dependent Clp protease adaptor protein ClpS
MTTDIIVDKKTKVNNKLKEPSKYKVIVCNDDQTSMEFVVSMLMTVFKHDEKSALTLTLQIHQKGSAVAGIYGFEIAEQKGIDATNLARAHGWPLIIKIEQE